MLSSHHRDASPTVVPTWNPSANGAKRAASVAVAMCRSRDASAAARVRPVGRPILPSALCHGATHTPRDLSKNGSGCPRGARLTTVNDPVVGSTTRLPRGTRGTAGLLSAASVGQSQSTFETYIET